MAKNTICLWYDKDAEAGQMGISWQITPHALTEAIEAARRG